MRCGDVDPGLAGGTWRERFVLLAIAALVFASRVPFLLPGYGHEPDGWRVAAVARRIAMTGEYSVSRFPGYPIHELSSALLWQGGPLALNGASALMSTLAAIVFAATLKLLGCRDRWLATLAMAFTPVIFIASTVAKDYVWGLAFGLGSLYLVLRGRPGIAGALLGLAIGTRITWGAMVLPLGLLLVCGSRAATRLRTLLTFSAMMALVGGAAFAPVAWKYGRNFLTFYDPKPWLWRDVLEYGSGGVWGRVGAVALALALLSTLVPQKRGPGSTSIPSSGSATPVIAWTIAIGLYGAVFLRLPHHSAYLIPAVPFTILLIGRFARRPVFIALCVALIISSLVSIGRTGLRAGPIFEDHAVRQSMIQYTTTVRAIGDRLQYRTVVVSGGWLPLIEATAPTLSGAPVEYVQLLDRGGVQDYISRGYRIRYLSGANELNRLTLAVNLDEYGGCELTEPVVRTECSRR